jgi:hypothetical protein
MFPEKLLEKLLEKLPETLTEHVMLTITDRYNHVTKNRPENISTTGQAEAI